jgi:hypothetical protein
MSWVQELVQSLRKLKNDRLYRRLPAGDIDVKISPKGEGTAILRKIGNWSPGGIYVPGKDVLPLETQVNLELSLGSAGTSALQLEGQIVRHQKNEETGEVVGMGIMFTNFTQNGLQILRDLLLNAGKQNPEN